jgi:hypothetical protein
MKFEVSHPRRKNKNAARMGHPGVYAVSGKVHCSDPPKRAAQLHFYK